MNIGKKILSAFVEVTGEEKPVAVMKATNTVTVKASPAPVSTNNKFQEHFENLFAEANLPGPDYYEFAKMVEAITVIPDEQARYLAAFAGLRVQGLDRQKLLATAADYLKMVETDVAAFQLALDHTVKEKVQGKQQEMEEKSRRIQVLSQEITALHKELEQLQNEIKENEEKIYINSNIYNEAAQQMKTKIKHDIEKIKQHLS